MMDKLLYRSLLPLVNDKDIYTLLVEYSEARISTLLHQMSTESNMDTVKSTQGAIRELRKIKTLRDEVIAGAK